MTGDLDSGFRKLRNAIHNMTVRGLADLEEELNEFERLHGECEELKRLRFKLAFLQMKVEGQARGDDPPGFRRIS